MINFYETIQISPTISHSTTVVMQTTHCCIIQLFNQEHNVPALLLMFLLLILSQSREAKSRQGRLHRSVQHVSVHQTSQRLQTGESQSKTQLKAQMNVLLFRVTSRGHVTKASSLKFDMKMGTFLYTDFALMGIVSIYISISLLGQWSAVLLWKVSKNGRLQCVNSSVKDTVKLLRCSPI